MSGLLCVLLTQVTSTADEFHKRTLEIWLNPQTLQGATIRQHLTVDWLQRARELSCPPEAVLEIEVTRRRIHQHFDVHFKEFSGDLSIRVASGLRQRIPRCASAQELPGYLPFFDWLVNEFYADYHEEIREKENSRRWADWSTRRLAAIEAFIKQQRKLGYQSYGFYYFYDDEYGEGYMEMPFFEKAGKTSSARERGWKDPPSRPNSAGRR